MGGQCFSTGLVYCDLRRVRVGQEHLHLTDLFILYSPIPCELSVTSDCQLWRKRKLSISLSCSHPPFSLRLLQFPTRRDSTNPGPPRSHCLKTTRSTAIQVFAFAFVNALFILRQSVESRRVQVAHTCNLSLVPSSMLGCR